MAMGAMIAEKDVLFNSMSAMIAREYVAADTAPVMVGYYRQAISGAGTINVTVDRNIEVMDAWCVKTDGLGGVGDTVTVQNAASAITDAMSLNVADNLVVRADEIDDANYQIAAGGTLRFVTVEASDADCICYVKVLFYT
jgi:hypothetical protein